MKTSKVKKVYGSGTWESPHGLMYTFEYEMEDGTILKANHKTETPLPEGTEVEYEVTGENSYGKRGKVKKFVPQQQSYSGKGESDKPFAASYGKDVFISLVENGIMQPKNLDDAMQMLNMIQDNQLDWLNKNK